MLLFACSVINNDFTCFFFYFTPVVLNLCLAILRKYPSNTKCNPLLSDIIDNLIAEVDSEIEKGVATHSTTDDGIPLTSLDADNFKLPSPGHASQPDVASVQLNDDDFTSESDDDSEEDSDNSSTYDSDGDNSEYGYTADDELSNNDNDDSVSSDENSCDGDGWNGGNDCSDDSDCGSTIASSTDEINDDDDDDNVSDYSPNGDGHQLQTDDTCDGDEMNNSKEPEDNSDDSRPGVMIVKMMMHQMMGPPSQ